MPPIPIPPFEPVLFEFFRWASAWLEIVTTAPPEPGSLLATLVREEDEMLIYAITAGPPGAPDVVKRELSVYLNGATEPDQIVDFVDGMELAFESGAQVKMELVDIDDADLESEAAVFEFTAADTLAPPKPGGFGVSLVREE